MRSLQGNYLKKVLSKRTVSSRELGSNLGFVLHELTLCPAGGQGGPVVPLLCDSLGLQVMSCC